MSYPFHIPVALLIGGFIVYLINVVSYRRRMKGARPPPGPRGVLLLGNALDLASDPYLLPSFNKWANLYGPIAQFRVLGKKHVFLSSEKIAEDLLSRRGNIYSDRGVPPATAKASGGIAPAIMDKNDLWRRQRKFLHNVMSVTVNVRYEPSMDIESKYTLLDLLETPEKFDDHLGRYAYGVLTRYGFGIRTLSLQDPIVQEVDDFGNDIVATFRPNKYISNLVPWLLYLPDWLFPESAALNVIYEKFTGMIKRANEEQRAKISQGTAPDCLHRYFLEHQAEYGLNDLEGGAVFQTLLGAGTRSPHNALLVFIIVMMLHPEWLEKLQEEVDFVTGSERLPEFSDVPHLPIVRAVLKESIRCRSIHAEIGIPHKLTEDDFYDGYFFEAGTVFHANTSAMFADPKSYPDGPVFNPARWLEPSYPTYKEPLTVHPNLQGFASFGYGRRACPGSNFTERSLVIMIARIVWACNIKKPIDPATKKEVVLDIKYEPVANPKPYPFPAEIEPRDQKRLDLVREAVRECLKNDPLVMDAV